jgi:diguanylate cyclase
VRRRGGPDRVLVGTAVATGALCLWLATDLGPPSVRELAFWLSLATGEVGMAICAWQVVRTLSAGDPARRFWAVFGISLLIVGIVTVGQTVASLLGLADVAALRGTPVFTAAADLSGLAMIVVMLTYPLGVTSPRDRLCLYLDIATVMAAATAASLYIAIPVGIATLNPTALVISGTLLVAVFTVAKLLLGGTSPFTLWAGVLGAGGTGIAGVEQGLEPMLDAGENHWLYGLRILSCALVFAGARVQLLHNERPHRPRPRRRRRYSALPYLAMLMVYTLLVGALASRGLDPSTWAVLAGAIGSTALVVARQLVSFADNADLLTQLDAHVERLKRSQDSLRGALTERDALADELRRLALYDNITGLGNRVLFISCLEQILASAEHPKRLVVMLIDLDDFKPVNDTHGHEAGDLVLKTVGERLRRCLRETDTVARLGGDEFAAVLNNPTTSVRSIAARVVETIAEPIPVGATTVTIGASVGVVIHQAGDDPVHLLRTADAAMYAAKRRGKGSYELLDHTTDRLLNKG